MQTASQHAPAMQTAAMKDPARAPSPSRPRAVTARVGLTGGLLAASNSRLGLTKGSEGSATPTAKSTQKVDFPVDATYKTALNTSLLGFAQQGTIPQAPGKIAAPTTKLALWEQRSRLVIANMPDNDVPPAIRSMSAIVNAIHIDIGLHGSISTAGQGAVAGQAPSAKFSHLALMNQLSHWFLADRERQVVAVAEVLPDSTGTSRKIYWAENSNLESFANKNAFPNLIPTPAALKDSEKDSDFGDNWFQDIVCSQMGTVKPVKVKPAQGKAQAGQITVKEDQSKVNADKNDSNTESPTALPPIHIYIRRLELQLERFSSAIEEAAKGQPTNPPSYQGQSPDYLRELGQLEDLVLISCIDKIFARLDRKVSTALGGDYKDTKWLNIFMSEKDFGFEEYIGESKKFAEDYSFPIKFGPKIIQKEDLSNSKPGVLDAKTTAPLLTGSSESFMRDALASTLGRKADNFKLENQELQTYRLAATPNQSEFFLCVRQLVKDFYHQALHLRIMLGLSNVEDSVGETTVAGWKYAENQVLEAAKEAKKSAPVASVPAEEMRTAIAAKKAAGDAKAAAKEASKHKYRIAIINRYRDQGLSKLTDELLSAPEKVKLTGNKDEKSNKALKKDTISRAVIEKCLGYQEAAEEDEVVKDVIAYRTSALNECVSRVKYSMNILDKLAHYSPTFFKFVRGTAFSAALISIRKDILDNSAAPAFSGMQDEHEIAESPDPVRLWLQLSTQWIHLFQGLRSTVDDQRNQLMHFFKRPCKFTRIVPPDVTSNVRASAEDVFLVSGLDEAEAATALKDFKGRFDKMCKSVGKGTTRQLLTWKESGDAKSHCECTMAMESVHEQGNWVDVGVSKKCCYLCNLWIQAFNSELHNKDNALSRVAVHSYHGKAYQWSPPVWNAPTGGTQDLQKKVDAAARTANRAVLCDLAKAMRTALTQPKDPMLLPDTGTSGDEFIRPSLSGTEYKAPAQHATDDDTAQQATDNSSNSATTSTAHPITSTNSKSLIPGTTLTTTNPHLTNANAGTGQAATDIHSIPVNTGGIHPTTKVNAGGSK